MVEELLEFEAPLTPGAVAAAERARRAADGRVSRLAGPCDPAALPLDVAYADKLTRPAQAKKPRR